TSCGLGSIKSNLGHLDVAAGAAGLIKTVLTLKHGLIPPSLHFEQPNPEIDLEGSGFRVITELTPWKDGQAGAPRRAGVSAFGIGGTNAHAVLEEAPVCEASGSGRESQLLVLSARDSSALEAVTTDLADHFEATSGLVLADAAFTLATGRRGHSHRRAVVCSGREAAAEALRTGDPSGAWTSTWDRAEGPPQVAFLLTGQGSQHPDMARALYQSEPVFRASLDRCLGVLARDAGVELAPMLGLTEPTTREASSRLTQTRFAQPALFAVEYSLARLWNHWGIHPAAMLGHSLGELVAACLAGVFSLPDALRLVAERGRLMQVCETGSMLAVELAEEAVSALLRSRPLVLAAVNGPRACVVSGETRALDGLEAELAAMEVKSARLETSHAFHSPAMDAATQPFTDRVKAIPLAAPSIPFLSNVTGTWITAAEATDPAYWGAQLRQTVRFMDGCGELLRSRHLLLEVGPGQSLATLAKQQPDGRQAPAILNSLPPRKSAGTQADPRQLIATLGRLWLHGAEPDWAAFYGAERRRRIPLPTYPFEGRRFWFESGAERQGPDIDNPLEAPLEAAVAVEDGQVTQAPNPHEATLAGIWQTLLGGEAPSATDDFFELGGSSLSAIQLTDRMSKTFGLEIGPSELLEAPTLGQLAALVAAEEGNGGGPGRRSCLVRLQPRGYRSPFFLVHPVGGTAFWFRDLAREMAPEQPLFALRSPGLEAGEETLGTISDMASHYLEAIRAVRPRGPYLLGGSSMGGSIAYEMAQQLVDQGEEVGLLALFDSPCLDQLPPRPDEAEMIGWAFDDRPPVPLDALRQLPAARQLDHTLEAARRAGNGTSPDTEQFRRRVRVIRSNVQALYTYRPEPLTSPLLFLRAAERRPGGVERPERPWIDLAAGGIEIHTVPGGHVSMNYPPHVGTVAERLMHRLRAAALS
ncbi:MAG: acyltransferase domain-containing protein, partial [Acidobacteriota bacterium]